MISVRRKKPRSARRDDAVSPVVGVMLMLVVTIIIAAVVSSFASGVGGSKEKAPVTSLGITIRAGGASTDNVYIENLGGETLDTGDLQIITTYTVPATYGSTTLSNAGRVVKHTTDGSLAPGGVNTWDITADPFIPQVSNENNQVVMGPGSTQERWFGEVLLRPGGILNMRRNPFLGFDVTDRETFGFKEGSIVHVTIVHKPSGKFIYDKDVNVIW